MQWGITLHIKSDFDRALWSLPPPSATRWLSKMDSSTTLEVLYHFQYTPQSWREWQQIASIKIQMKQNIPQLIFMDYMGSDEVVRVYTIQELSKSFSKFIKFHKPLYPSGKDEFMRSLTYYCQRLHYEQQLHIEAVIAMALHFNSKCGFKYSHREIMKKAKSVMMLDRSKWRVKLSEDALKKAHSQGGAKRVQQVREKFQTKRDEALILRADGMILKDIAIKLEVSLITVKRWKLPKC
jgi:hypothetical protein